MVRELEEYLGCGVLANGFSRVRCTGCGDELLVAFSCKRRGVCPSCCARRASDVAAHLVDQVLPRAPYRQWTLSLPIRLRWALARNGALCTDVLSLFVRTLFNALRARARSLALPARECGAVSFIQRFGSALRLNVHFHVLVPEGVFADDGTFHPLPSPEDGDVESLLETFLSRLVPLLEGFSLHANTRVHENDRTGLETLCRYGARGPLSLERLSLRDDGRLAWRMKRPAPDGSTHLLLTPLQLVRKLAALVPPPRFNLTRFHGVFVPNSKLRARVVPTPPPAPPPAQSPAPAHPAPPSRLHFVFATPVSRPHHSPHLAEPR